jgi:excisionase family DNA binding protein
MTAIPAHILTVEELADRLRVKPSWVYRHATSLGAYRLGKYLRFSWDRVLARLDELSTEELVLGSQPNDLKRDH